MIELIIQISTYAPFAIAALAIWFIIFRWPFIGFLLIIALIPGEELTTIASSRTIIWYLGIAVFMAYILRTLISRTRIITAMNIPTMIVFVWVLWGLFSIIWSQDRVASFERAMIIVPLFAFFWLVKEIITNNARLERVIVIYYLASILYSIVAIAIYFYADLRRVSLTSGQNPNAFARCMAISLLMTPYLFKRNKSVPRRTAIIFSAIIFGLVILLTGSRGTWIALLAVYILYLLLSAKKLSKVSLAFGIFLFIIASITILGRKGVLDEWAVERVKTVFDVEATKGGAGRINIWATGLEMIKANPLLGVGLGNFPTRFEDYIDRAYLFWRGYGIYPGRDPHNIFLSIQAELGIVGSFIFLMFLWHIFKNLIPYRNDMRVVFGILILFFLIISGIFEPILYRKYFWFSLGIATVIPLIIKREINRHERNKITNY